MLVFSVIPIFFRFRFMRSFILSLLLLLAVSAYAYCWPDDVRYVQTPLRNTWDKIFFEKQFLYSGLKRIQRAQIEARLPIDKSIAWWMVSGEDVEGSLQQHPLVSQVEVKGCEGSILPKWGCFEIAIKEREPSVVAFGKKGSWLVGDDGGFIAPISEEKGQAFLSSAKLGADRRPLSVRGLAVDEGAPDRLKTEVGYVREAVTAIEGASGLNVQAVDYLSNGELRVHFRGVSSTARFDRVKDSFDELGNQARRFTWVVAELRKSYSPLPREIDLAYDKLAVLVN